MPNGISNKVRVRVEEVAHLLRIRGCITIRDVMQIGFTHSQAFIALKYLVKTGRAVQVKLGRFTAVWCYSGHSAYKHLSRLRRALHTSICANARDRIYVTPSEALRFIMKDRRARKLISRFVDLKPVATTLCFLRGLMDLAYGGPTFIKNSGRELVYFVDCQRKRLPPLRLSFGGVQGVKV
jgi:hypothetical protein